jgi:RNA polymerase sigma-70 factor (ECF subfamily)
MPAASVAFESAHLSEVASYIARIDRTPDFIDEVRQRLRERLLVGLNPRISEYAGTGPLGGWVRVAAIRVALNVVREAKRDARLRGHSPTARHLEVDFLNGQYRDQVEAAFCSAFARLRPDERELLRLHYVEGMKQGVIGQRFGIDRTTASRRVGMVRRFLLEETHRQLRRLVPAITTQSRESLIQALRSQIDFDLEIALKR